MSYLNEFTTGVKHIADQVSHGWHSLVERASLALTRFTASEETLQSSRGLPWGILSCELSEDNEAYHLKIEVPGLNDSDLNLEVKSNYLVVSGERKYEHKTEQRNLLIQERAYGNFVRRFNLPDGIDVDHATAKYKKGVLSVYLPKQASDANHRKIPVNAQ